MMITAVRNYLPSGRKHLDAQRFLLITFVADYDTRSHNSQSRCGRKHTPVGLVCFSESFSNPSGSSVQMKLCCCCVSPQFTVCGHVDLSAARTACDLQGATQHHLSLLHSHFNNFTSFFVRLFATKQHLSKQRGIDRLWISARPHTVKCHIFISRHYQNNL